MKSSTHNQKADSGAIFRRLLRFMGPYRKGLTVSVICIILSSLFNSFGPFVLGRATDALAGLVTGGEPVYSEIRRFITILILLASIYILYAFFKYISTVILVRVSQKTIRDLRNDIDRKFQKLPLNYFDTNTYGDVLSRITNDVDTISNSLQQSLEQIVTAVTSVIFILAMMLYISPMLTLIGIVTVPLALVFSMKIAGASQKYFKTQQETLGEMNGYVEEMYTGHTIVSAYGTEEETIDEFSETNRTLYDSGWKSQFMSSTMMPVTQGMANLGYVFVVIVGGAFAIDGRMTIGMIQSFIQYLRQFSQPINQTVQIANVLQSTAAAAERVFEFLDEQEEVPETASPIRPQQVRGDVEFRHVHFGYRPDKLIIHDFSSSVRSGQTIAIVGPTGAGKTTVVKLLMRFYELNSGSILIDGHDILDFTRNDLRSMFGMVLQETWLYSASIMENIRYGNFDRTDEEVIAAAKTAHCDAFIRSMPGGYQMVINEEASNLSQGQKQLLTIARTILANPRILILDEATSSIDTRTEVLIQNAMNSLMQNRTSFVIAHRLSTIRDADLILVMKDGDIIEQGNHMQLLEKKGFYADLYQSQFALN